jgi:hypothetical protein
LYVFSGAHFSLSTVSSNDNNTYVAPVMSFSKLPKHDIRKLYPDMFAMVMNGGDVNIYQSFFSDYSTKHLTFEQSMVKPALVDVPIMFRLDNLSMYLQFWYNQWQVAPDMCFRQISDSKIIRQSTNDESRIETMFELTLTRIFDIPFNFTIPALEDGVSILSETPESHTKSNTNKNHKNKRKFSTNNSQTFDDNVIQRLRSTELLKRPLAVTVKGLITLYLDRNKVITGIKHSQVQDEYVEL